VRLLDFLLPFNPFATNKYRDLVWQMAAQLSALREVKAEHGTNGCPYPLHFEPNGLLPWGVTDNGDVLFWLTVDHPDQWTVVVNESRGPTYEHFPGSMTVFLQAFLARSLETEIFPDDLRDDGPAIVPVKP
jgi:hypothetical protein